MFVTCQKSPLFPPLAVTPYSLLWPSPPVPFTSSSLTSSLQSQPKSPLFPPLAVTPRSLHLIIPNLSSTIPAKVPPLSCPSSLTPVPSTVTNSLSYYTTPVQPTLSPDMRPGILVKVNKIRITSLFHQHHYRQIFIKFL
ncbi:hypothetical protein Pmani_039370 [Petrolisthes manimaculis]|uniref:Uncharacterized protein n=1 Tax=Petrolisthes manimaculis TaxID=1843537 RepID=A0AAE1TJM0_9EUCA|nr:hypothetical protein Pmani_039370 [Petrolisthes manimaculis]